MVCTFYAGDELGNIKTLRIYEKATPSGSRIQSKTIYDGSADGKRKGIQGIALGSGAVQGRSINTSHADGSVSSLSLSEDGIPNRDHEWQEPRMKPGQRFVGIAAHGRNVYTCTSNGALRKTWADDDNLSLQHAIAALPMRICDWHLAADEKSFIYGGEEVEVSVWDTERAFASELPSVELVSQTSKKRKRSGNLLPGETWRAKNVPNDFLSLRQPVHNTSVTHLDTSSDILAGTIFGNVRRYDTRSGGRPVSNWKGVSKVGGVKLVEKGYHDNEVFVADQGCNLFAVDMRNGRVLYGYKGMSGAVSSVASAPSLLGSVSLDRFFRLHTTKPPPEDAKQRQEEKGEVVDKVYMRSIPTVVVWDVDVPDTDKQKMPVEDDLGEEYDGDADDVWDHMEQTAQRNRKKKTK
ncbi:hypothetical protein NEOLEDRAFT_1132280 [Neolentinus lepideus HHB14362 ss-1]|uniref:Ribosome biogenesis protein NSA1 n=1 Tax=Neolentinus lepideus HHB14362 ss-1 TaxID=1314782 RepID=A0A165T7G6_9AGAM|nr:hypothetical protein NEOLEDRAFT_1132280 [Neolentinus lepideus HHB14362 ss-1]